MNPKSAIVKDDAGDDTSAELIKTLNHRLRRDILRVLHASEGPQSPVRIAKKLDEPLSNVSYHAKMLLLRRGTALVRTRRVRGAVEHFYASRVADNQAVRALLEETRRPDADQKLRT
jgi:DNA-binding transcriptional ArsR family regulator